VWLNTIIAFAAIVTVALSYMTAKEIVKSIRENSEGKSSGRCDLD